MVTHLKVIVHTEILDFDYCMSYSMQFNNLSISLQNYLKDDFYNFFIQA